MLWIKIRRRKYEWKYKNIIYHWMERITRLAENSIQLIWKGQCKERYFTHDLKREQRRIDRKTGEVIVIPGREDSYERLIEAEKQFIEETESVEDAAIRAVMLEKLNGALHMLTEKELGIIYFLFYMEISETQLAEKMGLARTTLQSQKYRILEKLKDLL